MVLKLAIGLPPKSWLVPWTSFTYTLCLLHLRIKIELFSRRHASLMWTLLVFLVQQRVLIIYLQNID